MVYLVTGTGRSGTSAVARVLRDHGVYMGEHLNKDYEDTAFRNLNASLIQNKIPYFAYEAELRKLINTRMALDRWGMKDPRLAYFLGLYLHYIPSPVVVWCTRDVEQSAQSCVRQYGWSEVQARGVMHDRHNLLENITSSVECIEIDFTERLTDDQIAERLGVYENIKS